MSKLHVVQVNYFKYLLDEFERMGLSTQQIIRKSKLNQFDLSNPDNFVPVSLYHNMLSEMQNQEIGDDPLGFFQPSLKVKNLASVGDVLLTSPDILSAVYDAVLFSPMFYSTQRIGLNINGPETEIWLKFIEKESEATQTLYDIELGLIMDHLRLALGDKWNPIEIKLPTKYIPNLDHVISGNAPVKVSGNTGHLGVVIKTAELRTPFSNPNPRSDEIDLSALTDRKKLEHLLNAHQDGFVPTIEIMADYFNLSERSLRRVLNEHNFSYSKLLEDWRFKQSIAKMSDTSLSIKDISQQLGYQNSQNFIRAFNRWTGVSPQQYRELKSQ
ncbi:MAG: helix-turn-helix transcriptional regulator [Schleiferiaceae bacterium]|jgi:AraC-like DNA-binding protein|nr:helix-turn-helix transcriptional regulator [Schleiferiaceae bacterium]